MKVSLYESTIKGWFVPLKVLLEIYIYIYDTYVYIYNIYIYIYNISIYVL